MADGRDTVSCLLLRPRWGVRSIVMSVSVCLCARLSVHVRASPFFVHVTYGRGSVLHCRRSDTLRISGFVDDVIFAQPFARCSEDRM